MYHCSERNYYCLDNAGKLWILGDHGDFDAAEATAESMGLKPIWILDHETAEQWRAVLHNDEVENE